MNSYVVIDFSNNRCILSEEKKKFLTILPRRNPTYHTYNTLDNIFLS